MIQFSDREIIGERLVLDSKTELYYLGHNLTLRGCTVVIRVPERSLVVARVRFLDCVIDVKRELVNFSWTHASLAGCRFNGRISGSDFGYWRDSTVTWEQASISDCDFSGARLNACRFHECDPRTLKLPPWPCFTVLDPIGNSQKLGSVEWPGIFGDIIVLTMPRNPASTVAETFHAPTIAKLCKTTAEALRPVIEQFDCIVY